MKRFQLLGLILVFFSCNHSEIEKSEYNNELFQLISGEDSGVTFMNNVEDQRERNILSYRNFYNGGGVGIGDINNDGLEDLYFISNQHANKLYLNKGNWMFEDITANAGVGGTGLWSTGVAFADINHDGFLDIYVCNSGDVSDKERINELFINNGDLTFSEEAASRGLDSESFSVHASFFDYDQDGDLDCYLLNNCFITPEKMLYLSQAERSKGTVGGDKLYQNNDGKFIDVTEEAGIHTGDIGFGLGVSISDLNDDMLPDIYISNDFWERDYLFINKGDGTFVDQISTKIAMTSMNSMGSDIGDINNDGQPDIMTTDMLPIDNYRLKTMTQFQPFRMGSMTFDSLYHHQLMQNTLQLNMGNARFQEIAHMSNVAASDWSWGALILDLNLDGWKDIFVSNGIQRDMGDFDFVDIITNKNIVDQIIEENDGFDFRQFLPFLSSTKISNSAFINQKNYNFKNLSKELGLNDPSFSNGSAYGDLDNDGDLDLVINNANMEAFLYRNNSVQSGENNYLKIILNGPIKNQYGVGAKVMISKGDKKQELQHFLSRGFQSSVAPGLIFGTASIGEIDTLSIIWPGGKQQVLTNVSCNQTIQLNYNDAIDGWKEPDSVTKKMFSRDIQTKFEIQSVHTENRFNDFDYEKLAFRMLSTEGPQIVKGDVNGDNHEDILLLGAADDPTKLFLQSRDGSFKIKKIEGFSNDAMLEGTCGVLEDFDNDNDLDLLIGHGGNELKRGRANFAMRYYENDGKGNFEINIMSTPQVSGNLSCIEPADFDKDGDMDLFIGARAVPGNYGLVPSSFLLLNQGNGTYANITTEEFGRLGMVTDATWSDVDNDDDLDLVVVGDWMPITVFENTPGAIKKKGIVPDSFGWWSSIEAKDLDGDGDDDYVLGNWGTNSKFKASKEKPLRMYIKDFDRNGKNDHILEWFPPGESVAYPFVSRDELLAQIPMLKNKVEKYADYGNSTYFDLFDPEQRKGVLELKTNYLQSAILWKEEKSFQLVPLPVEAQISPVYTTIAEDLDADGEIDILLFGNFYGLKPEAGRLDANRGVLLKGNGNKNFQAVPNILSGLFVEGEARDALMLSTEAGKKLMIARNNDSVLQYELILE